MLKLLKCSAPTSLKVELLTDVKYTRGYQLGLKKNLQDSVVKLIIFNTQRMKFSVKDLFNVSKYAVLCGLAYIY